MLRLTDRSVVYICLPAASATGGLELLFQLCHELIGVGIETYLVYRPSPDENGDGRAVVHPEFRRYRSAFVPAAEISDRET